MRYLGEHYPEDAKIIRDPNEYFLNQQGGKQKERITDSIFRIAGFPEKWYHIECQSVADSSMVIRMFEYDALVALVHHNLEEGVLTVRFPESAVMFLRQSGNTPDAMKVRIVTKGGSVMYDIPTIKVQEYSLDNIIERKLFFLIPFYIFRFEKGFAEMDKDVGKQDILKRDCIRISQFLAESCEAGAIIAYERAKVVDMTKKVAHNLAEKHENVRKGVSKVTGGKVLDYEAKRIRMSGIEEGRAEGRDQLIDSWLTSIRNVTKKFSVTIDEAMDTLGIPDAERPELKKML